MAIAAFVLGLLSVPLFIFLFIAILAIVLGYVSYRRAFYGAPHRGLAGWGLGLGIASLAFFVFFAFNFTGDL